MNMKKTLITPNSDFDRYLKGDKTALTEQQVHGYELFKQHKCDTCHTGVAWADNLMNTWDSTAIILKIVVRH